jgi:Glyoxalase/Bleomycin resistance protein/Dioxygenase superfamily
MEMVDAGPMLLEWGQPLEAVVQFAYVVEDVDQAAMRYVEQLGVGPWFVRGPFQPPQGMYRGEPTHATFEVAHAFAGSTMVELIRQHDDNPSVFNERPTPERYGFHHWARLTARFDEEKARYATLGYEEAFFDRLPSGARVVYMDATRDFPGMIELLEHNEAQAAVYADFWRPSVGWDGSDPIRRD